MELPINSIIQGDALEVLKTLPHESIDSVITSPPYWALRDYGVLGQLGLEPTFQEYIQKLLNIFDEVKRVLKKEGTCWVNLGDTYSNSGKGGDSENMYAKRHTEFGKISDIRRHGKPTQVKDLPTKSLCNIPSRFSIGMQDKGWTLRNEIIWHKPNCMPASVEDRFTVDFEKVFFFVKNKKYYFEQQYEPIKQISIDRLNRAVSNKNKWANGAGGQSPHNLHKEREHKRYEASNAPHEFKGGDHLVSPFDPLKGRNKRSVWRITTKGYSEAHFATFPEALIEPMVKAGCPERGVILDPFMGAGTTALVAKNLKRNYVGIELNPEYIKIANERLRQEILI